MGGVQRHGGAIITIALWAAAVLAGFGVLWRYTARPGAAAASPEDWPSASTIARASDRYTLLMFLHPRCPCSRASLVELGHTLQRTSGRVDAVAVFVRPPGVDASWSDTELRTFAASLPGVRIVDDDGGVEARRFGGRTSGVAILYDGAGRRLFSGGLTAMRGHEGSSLGEERIVDLVRGGTPDRVDSPVFGCALLDSKEAP